MAGVYSPPGLPHDRRLHLRGHEILLGPLTMLERLNGHGCRLIPTGAGLGVMLGPRVTACELSDADGAPWLLLGQCAAAFGHGDIKAQISRTPGRRLGEVSASWSGRWMLVGAEHVITDAGALVPFFYSEFSGLLRIASNSPRVMVELLQPPIAERRTLRQGLGIDWYAPPLTQWAGVRKLLPSQELHLTTWTPSPSPSPFPSSPAPPRSIGEIAEQVGDGLGAAMTSHVERADTPWLALTAGMDSRTLLAVASHAGLPVRTYVLSFAGISGQEIAVGRRLAELAAVDHVAIPHRRRINRIGTGTFDRYTQRRVVEHDRRWVPAKAYHFADERDIIFRGSGFELGRCFYWEAFPEQDGPVPPPPEALAKRMGMRRTPPRLRQALSEWREWVVAAPVAAADRIMDWRDRFYWEQRMGGWLADIEQALEQIPSRTVHPANCAALMKLLLLPTPSDREAGSVQREVIRQRCPELLDVPFNPPDVAGARRRERLRSRSRQLAFEVDLLVASWMEGETPGST